MIAALPQDAARRQLFVPLQLLQQHGSGMEEVFAGKETPKIRAALDQLIAEARGHLMTALALLASVPPEARPVFLPLALVRRELRGCRGRTMIRSCLMSRRALDALDAVAGVAVAGVWGLIATVASMASYAATTPHE